MPTLAIGQAQLPLDQIHTNPDQPRQQFDPEAQKALERSLSQRGLINPVSVVQRPEGGYLLIAGERRFRAAQALRWKSIDARIWPAKTAASEVEALAVVENVQRRDLNPLEEARAYKHLAETQNMTQQEIARLAGRPQSVIALYLSINDQPEAIQNFIARTIILPSHVRILSKIVDISDRVSWAEKVADKGWSFRELDRQLKDYVRLTKTRGSEEALSLPVAEVSFVPVTEHVPMDAGAPSLNSQATADSAAEDTTAEPPLTLSQAQPEVTADIASVNKSEIADPLSAFWSVARDLAPTDMNVSATFAKHRGWKLAVEIPAAEERQARFTLAEWLVAFGQRLRPEILPGSAPAPAAPRIIDATYVNGHRLQLRWSPGGEGFTYRLFRAPEAASNFERFGDEDLRSSGAVVDCWADCYQWYRLAVMAVDLSGHESALSEPVRFDMSALNNANAVVPLES